MSRFAGKRVLITGGTSGIGLAGARRIAAEGGRLCITGVTPARLHAARRELPLDSIVLDNDAADPNAVSALVDVAESMGGLDGLWLNAGYAQLASIEAGDACFFDAMVSVNQRAPALQLAALTAHLRPGCSVLFTASVALAAEARFASSYVATKAALVAMAQCHVRALGERRIRVNVLLPGPIATRFREFLHVDYQRAVEAEIASRVPLARSGTDEEAAAVALFLLSDDASFVTGSQYVVDGGLGAV
ncbi:MAG: SDR family oxidoreductase [Hyphomicrobiales bacterium]|nr:MAG: SDR family oxidoreductase [Hyphomicrobiales bacterium]